MLSAESTKEIEFNLKKIYRKVCNACHGNKEIKMSYGFMDCPYCEKTGMVLDEQKFSKHMRNILENH